MKTFPQPSSIPPDAVTGAMNAGRILALSEMREKTAESLFRKAVTMGQNFAAKAMANKAEIFGGAIGAGLAAGGTHLIVRRRDGGKKMSILESHSKGFSERIKQKKKVMKAEGRKPGYNFKLMDAASKAYGPMATAMAEHPVRSLALPAGLGLTLGRRSGKDLSARIKRIIQNEENRAVPR